MTHLRCTSGHAALGSTRADAEAQELLQELAQVIGDLASHCVIIGGVAVNFWAEPRFTKDIDFTIAASATELDEVTRRFLRAGWVVTRAQVDDPNDGFDFRRFVVPGTRKLVEFQAARTPYQQLVVQRGRRLEETQAFGVATPEDIIVLKLIANRSQDLADVVEIGKRPELDWGYIAHWAAEWGVSDRLEWLKQALENERQRLRDLYS